MQLRPLKQKWTSAGQVCMKSETVMAMAINKLGSVLQLHRICFADTKVERDIPRITFIFILNQRWQRALKKTIIILLLWCDKPTWD